MKPIDQQEVRMRALEKANKILRERAEHAEEELAKVAELLAAAMAAKGTPQEVLARAAEQDMRKRVIELEEEAHAACKESLTRAAAAEDLRLELQKAREVIKEFSEQSVEKEAEISQLKDHIRQLEEENKTLWEENQGTLLPKIVELEDKLEKATRKKKGKKDGEDQGEKS